jgi:rRNA maturation endonuclease Nob1
MYLPIKYLNENGTRECAQCHKKFAVPDDDVTEYVDVCEECGPKLEAAYAAAETKANESAETQKAVDAAVGN